MKKKYGNGRLKCDNPFDVLDAFNVEMSFPELVRGREISEQEANI